MRPIDDAQVGYAGYTAEQLAKFFADQLADDDARWRLLSGWHRLAAVLAAHGRRIREYGDQVAAAWHPAASDAAVAFAGEVDRLAAALTDASEVAWSNYLAAEALVAALYDAHRRLAPLGARYARARAAQQTGGSWLVTLPAAAEHANARQTMAAANAEALAVAETFGAAGRQASAALAPLPAYQPPAVASDQGPAHAPTAPPTVAPARPGPLAAVTSVLHGPPDAAPPTPAGPVLQAGPTVAAPPVPSPAAAPSPGGPPPLGGPPPSGPAPALVPAVVRPVGGFRRTPLIGRAAGSLFAAPRGAGPAVIGGSAVRPGQSAIRGQAPAVRAEGRPGADRPGRGVAVPPAGDPPRAGASGRPAVGTHADDAWPTPRAGRGVIEAPRRRATAVERGTAIGDPPAGKHANGPPAAGARSGRN